MSRGRRLDPAWITVDTSKHASPTIHDTAFSVSARIPRLTRAFAYTVSYSEKKKRKDPFSLPFEPILLSTRLETLVPEDFEMFVSNEEANEDGGNF